MASPGALAPWQGAKLLTMENLLQLGSRFRRTIKDRIAGRPDISASANFTETNNGPMVVDHNNPAIKLVFQGQEVVGCIIDGGFGVNVISPKTCEQMGISE